MKFIAGTSITDAVLISSNVAENDHAAWSGATTYALADRVISTTTHKIYESAQAGNLNHAPTTDDGTWWIDVGATNRWKMFDQGVGSQTENASTIVVTLAPGLIDSLALLDIVASSVQVVVVADSATIYDETLTLGDSTILSDWFEYFFDDISTQTALTVVGLPVYSGGEITITITAPVTARCGTLAIGRMVNIGKTRFGAQIGIIDYSRKNTDEFGQITVVERSYARKVSADVLVDNARIDYITSRLSEVRATPCVFIVDDKEQVTSMTVYGFLKDWGISITYPEHSEANITIEGLT